jgi:primary-amine oxidase
MVFTVDQESGGRKYGTSLGGCLYAPVHQHFFVARMDFCVDGQQNSIIEYNAKAESDGPHNPTLNGFYFEEKILESELMAVRDLSPETAR